jgi:hypothetical protein
VGDAEVGELREARPGRRLGEHHHVLGLHVAVDDPPRMRVLERLAQGDPDPGDVPVGQRLRLGQLGERPSRHQLRDQEEVAVVGAELVERHDARVVQSRRGARLPVGALVAVLARDDLHGHVALQAHVPGLPDHAEAAGSQTPLEPVPVEHQLAVRVEARGQRLGGARRMACHPSSVFGSGSGVPLVTTGGPVILAIALSIDSVTGSVTR